MQTKNKILQILKNPFWIFVVVMLSMAFGVGKLPPAHAQGINDIYPISRLRVMSQNRGAKFSSQVQSVQNPQWKILLLIYSSTDFSYSDASGQHRVVASMSQSEIDRTTSAVTRFVEADVPELTSGYMIPILTVRKPSRALTTLDTSCGYWPNRTNTIQELDPAFDSVIVVWDDSGTDINTGQPADLNSCGGLAIPNGIGQTYLAIPVDSVSSDQQNVFKHEWGHSILFYYDASGIPPKPSVDNHINNTTNQYVNCISGSAYILQDETNNNPIPNSIYNNYSGFTHDYYSGLTARPEQPNICLGINHSAWSTGGPVSKPLTQVNILVNGGFENGTTSPDFWTKDAWIMSRSTFNWDSIHMHSGSRSVKIVNNTTNDSRWIQTVFVQPNSDYRLSGWIKTNDIPQNGNQGANLSILDTWISTTKLFGTNDWTYVSVDFNTESSTSIQVAARLGMYSGDITGTAWFDDLKLELLSNPVCYTLTKSVIPIEGGSIVADPPPNCTNGTQYVHGTTVNLLAVPNSGYHLSSWTGVVHTYENPTPITFTSNKSVIANFTTSNTSSTIKSTASQDGHILESTETSNTGGTKNSGAATFFLGDNAQNKQYRSILSFNTSLPTGAVITKVTLKIKYAGKAGTNPFSTHGKLLVDVRKGAFSNNSSLQLGDFKAAASKANVGNIPKTLSGGWYTKVWTSGIFGYINTSGVTQFRLRFAKDDNNDFGADYLKIYSGNSTAANRPQLIVEYYVP